MLHNIICMHYLNVVRRNETNAHANFVTSTFHQTFD